MKIAVIGSGYVGLTTGVCLAKVGHQVICADVDVQKINLLKRGKSPIFEPELETLISECLRSGSLDFTTDNKLAVQASDAVFICVNTPPKPDGQADLRYIEAVAKEISQYLNGYKVIIDKSTVPVRTAERVKQTIQKYSRGTSEFDVVSNPEFLREGNAVHDTLHPDRIVIGVESDRARQLMLQVFKPIIDADQVPVVITSVRSAELIKHGANSFLATKISFANVIAEVCESIGANADDVLEAIGLDRRIGKDFLRPGIGFGGSCFPKDLAAFKKTLEILNIDSSLFSVVEKINDSALTRFLKKIERELWVVDKKRIAVLGLAFKPDTDDIRNSQALKIIQKLKQDGADVVCHDPQAMPKVKAHFSDIQYAATPYEAVTGSEACIVCTEWNEYKQLDFSKVRELMLTPVIFDGRNALAAEDLKKLGFQYFGVGRG